MVEIRQMRKEDLGRVAEIEREIFSMPWSEKGFYDSIMQEYTCYLVAISEGRIIGYCGFMQSFHEADITNVAVEEKSRGQGVARCMLTELIERGKKRGVQEFTLEVRKSNKAARCLYQNFGFQEEGIRKNFYEKPKEDAIIMWRHS